MFAILSNQVAGEWQDHYMYYMMMCQRHLTTFSALCPSQVWCLQEPHANSLLCVQGFEGGVLLGVCLQYM
eukprot:419114-Amphidinium_carterae.1